MSGLEDLYREIILDHYRNPRHRGELEVPPAHRAEGFNPLCGDEIVVFIALDDESKGDDAVINEIRVGGQGCSISQSSASMMAANVQGKTLGQVKELSRSFKSMMSIHEEDLEADGDWEPSADLPLGDLEALRGVVKFPVRIKCATLSWNTLLQSFEDLEEANSAS